MGFAPDYAPTTGTTCSVSLRYGVSTIYYVSSYANSNEPTVNPPKEYEPVRSTFIGRVNWSGHFVERELQAESLRALVGGFAWPDTKRLAPPLQVDEKRHRWRAVALRPRS